MRKLKRQDPQTPEEWQRAVDSAAGCRAIADCITAAGPRFWDSLLTLRAGTTFIMNRGKHL